MVSTPDAVVPVEIDSNFIEELSDAAAVAIELLDPKTGGLKLKNILMRKDCTISINYNVTYASSADTVITATNSAKIAQITKIAFISLR